MSSSTTAVIQPDMSEESQEQEEEQVSVQADASQW